MAEVIDNTEALFRVVRNSPGVEYRTLADGTVVVCSSAFNDKARQPSVDREKLRNDPRDCAFNPDDGIIKLIAQEVREIDSVKIGPDGELTYDIDVIHRPLEQTETLPANPAHAQVEYTPGEMSGSKFKKLKEALAYIANRHAWVIKPNNHQSS